MKAKIAWHGSVEASNSIGEVGVNLVEQFIQHRIPIWFDKNVYFDETHTPSQILSYKTLMKNVEKPDIVLDWTVTPERSLENYASEIKYFPYDEPNLPEGMVDRVNRIATSVIGPSKWCCKNYKNSGISVPIHYVPHGVDTELYSYVDRFDRKYDKARPFTFFNLSTGIPRKNLYGLVKSFYMAFPDEEDVRLVMKVRDVMTRRGYVKGNYDESEDPRIITYSRHMPLNDLIRLYHEADCYVFPTLVEGFSLTTLFAMSTGLPTILPTHTAVGEQCDDNINYPITDYFRNIGEFGFVPDAEECASLMREVYEDYKTAFKKGKKAAAYVRDNWTWNNAFDMLIESLKDYI